MKNKIEIKNIAIKHAESHIESQIEKAILNNEEYAAVYLSYTKIPEIAYSLKLAGYTVEKYEKSNYAKISW
jgi:DNA-binding CsgD family transcriptional regulator